jgi:hypothetical protein
VKGGVAVSNGNWAEADVEYMLRDVDDPLQKWQVRTIHELKQSMGDLNEKLERMADNCLNRPAACKREFAAKREAKVPAEDKRTWVMWGLGMGALKSVLLPIIVALVVALVAR